MRVGVRRMPPWYPNRAVDTPLSSTDIRARFDATQDHLSNISERLRKLDEALRGNGGPGLFTEFARSKDRIDRLEDFCADVRGIRRWLVGGILAAVGSVVWTAVIWAMKMQ